VATISGENKLKLLNLENGTLTKRYESLKQEIEMFRSEINLLRQTKGFDITEYSRRYINLEKEMLGFKKLYEDSLFELDKLRTNPMSPTKNNKDNNNKDMEISNLKKEISDLQDQSGKISKEHSGFVTSLRQEFDKKATELTKEFEEREKTLEEENTILDKHNSDFELEKQAWNRDKELNQDEKLNNKDRQIEELKESHAKDLKEARQKSENQVKDEVERHQAELTKKEQESTDKIELLETNMKVQMQSQLQGLKAKVEEEIKNQSSNTELQEKEEEVLTLESK